jgi:hypothetical protein
MPPNIGGLLGPPPLPEPTAFCAIAKSDRTANLSNKPGEKKTHRRDPAVREASAFG